MRQERAQADAVIAHGARASLSRPADVCSATPTNGDRRHLLVDGRALQDSTTYRGEKTTNDKNAFRRGPLAFLNRTNAVRAVATANIASDLLARKSGS